MTNYFNKSKELSKLGKKIKKIEEQFENKKLKRKNKYLAMKEHEMFEIEEHFDEKIDPSENNSVTNNLFYDYD